MKVNFTEIIVIPTPIKDMNPIEQTIDEITMTIPETPMRKPECVFEGKEPIAREI